MTTATATAIRPGYNLSIEITYLLGERFPEVSEAVEGLDQPVTYIVEFQPGCRLAFGRLARDLRGKRGSVLYVYPRQHGKRWVELVDAREVAALAKAMDDVVQDDRLRRVVKARG
ncbi:hypothetical protein [Streptomyces sp. NPDC087862]|uniref:hypothetical protein n=1 Tax=Streptomyces sp. NPDC087862 TaxID=3365813 RepID=UPI003800E90B